VTFRVERLKSFTPRRSSSWSMRRPTIAGVMPSSRAAADKLPRWATSTKVVSSLNRSISPRKYQPLRCFLLLMVFELGNELQARAQGGALDSPARRPRSIGFAA